MKKRISVKNPRYVFDSYHAFQCKDSDVVLERLGVEGLVHVDKADGDDDSAAFDVAVHTS